MKDPMERLLEDREEMLKDMDALARVAGMWDGNAAGDLILDLRQEMEKLDIENEERMGQIWTEASILCGQTFGVFVQEHLLIW